jgi:hypothetical protein
MGKTTRRRIAPSVTKTQRGLKAMRTASDVGFHKYYDFALEKLDAMRDQP